MGILNSKADNRISDLINLWHVEYIGVNIAHTELRPCKIHASTLRVHPTIIYTLLDYELNLKNDYLKLASHRESETLYE